MGQRRLEDVLSDVSNCADNSFHSMQRGVIARNSTLVVVTGNAALAKGVTVSVHERPVKALCNRVERALVARRVDTIEDFVDQACRDE